MAIFIEQQGQMLYIFSMNKISYLFILVLASFSFFGSAFGASDIILSNKIKSTQQKKITQDLELLDNFQFRDQADLKTLRVLGLSELNAATANEWLHDRVKYIVEEKVSLKKLLYVELRNIDYPNSQTQLFSASDLMSNNQDISSFITMTNIGAEAYLRGKAEHKIYGMKIKQTRPRKTIQVRVDSPRVGVLQIGTGLFSPDLAINRNDPNAIANSIFRLAFFFHEARHSDGNGASLGFTHSSCPAGHDYEDELACDESLNGSYTVGAVMAREMMLACKDNCSERDKEMLKIFIIDNYNRVQTKTHLNSNAKYLDATPEKL